MGATWRYTFYIPALGNNNMEGARNFKVEVALAVHTLHDSEVMYVRSKQEQTWWRAKLLCCVQKI